MTRCVICRGRLNERCICQRCGADLRRLRAVQTTARCLAKQAVRALQRHDYGQAEEHIRQAVALSADPLHRLLRDFIYARILGLPKE